MKKILVTLMLISGIITLPVNAAEIHPEDSLTKPVNAAEIYPEFTCGCCGKPLDPNKICCGDMRYKIDYINAQADAGFSSDEIMFRTAKKFGMESLAKAETRQMVKDRLIAQAPADAPKMVFEQSSQNLGQVSQAGGVVSTTFSFKNEGKSDLIIDKITTSCGCSSASIIYQGKEGPTFGMPGHGKKNPTNWSVSIAPGDEAQLKVYYDPNTHGKQKKDRMSITRTISVFSNDPVEFEKKIRIELEQVLLPNKSTNSPTPTEISAKIGGPKIAVTPDSFDLGTVAYGEVAKHTFRVKNLGDESLKILRLSTSCGCTEAFIDKKDKIIAPDQGVDMLVTFDPAGHGDDSSLGDLTRVVYIKSNDQTQPEVEVKISVKVVKSD